MYYATDELAFRVAAFLGTDVTDAAMEHTDGAISFVKAYTRGVGFDDASGYPRPNDELASVIIAAAARSLSNPHNLQSQTSGPFVVTHFQVGGFSLAERAVLDRYRVRAR